VIFIDTSAWFATFVPTDPNHSAAKALFASTPAQQFVTTDYVLSETLTLFRVRGESRRALELGHQILESRVCQLAWVEKPDVFKAWTIFESYRDKSWSFTDCVSRTVIARLSIAEAFAFDEHFRQFGNVAVIPKV
jgi:predicted nucleic acid-binding protein